LKSRNSESLRFGDLFRDKGGVLLTGAQTRSSNQEKAQGYRELASLRV
jgi:hypothetical protein